VPSSIASGPKFRSIKGGGRYRISPDFIVPVDLAAADFSGANSGKYVFVVPTSVNGAIFLGIQHIHATAGTNTYRVKKVLAATTAAAGVASNGTTHVDISAAVALTATANTQVEAAAVTTAAVNVLAPGDKVAVASAAGTASLAGGIAFLRFAWL
jgi:hypothetical protein